MFCYADNGRYPGPGTDQYFEEVAQDCVAAAHSSTGGRALA